MLFQSQIFDSQNVTSPEGSTPQCNIVQSTKREKQQSRNFLVSPDPQKKIIATSQNKTVEAATKNKTLDLQRSRIRKAIEDSQATSIIQQINHQQQFDSNDFRVKQQSSPRQQKFSNKIEKRKKILIQEIQHIKKASTNSSIRHSMDASGIYDKAVLALMNKSFHILNKKAEISPSKPNLSIYLDAK